MQITKPNENNAPSSSDEFAKSSETGLPTEAANIPFDLADSKYLYGVVAMMWQQAKKLDEMNAGAWGIIGQKIYTKESIYSRHEAELLKIAADTALSAANKAHEKAQDLPVRLRAATLIDAFTAIKGKIDNAEWKNVRLRERSGDLQGQDQGREQGQDHGVPGSPGRGAVVGEAASDVGQS